MRSPCAWLGAILLFLAASLSASIFSSITGLIHDPEHRPVQGARVTLSAENSKWSQVVTSDDSGQFRFANVPLGNYTVRVEAPDFVSQIQKLTLTSSSEARLHFPLAIAAASESVEVKDAAPGVNPDSSTSTSVISRTQIADTPGASQTNSMAMITNHVPGSFVVHDQLHIRGGHQVSWLLDGVPVPNTSIASNVGPQFDPKDIDSIEVQRGSYSAEYGDRTFGVFNVVTRSGFERNREAELVTSYGSFNNTNDQLSFGDHTERFAYYGSVTGYRTDLGLETPVPQAINDQAAGLSAFTSLIFNKDASNQLRLVASARGDHYQAPIDPAAPLHDVENERDDFVNFTWLHTLGQGTSLTVSPFYHFNRAHYIPSPQDAVLSEYDRGSNYLGGVATVGVTRGRHNFRTGVQLFGERDDQLYSVTTAMEQGGSLAHVYSVTTAPEGRTSLAQRFSAGKAVRMIEVPEGRPIPRLVAAVSASDVFRRSLGVPQSYAQAASDPDFSNRTTLWASNQALFLEDQFKATSWLTFNAGLRLTHYGGPDSVSENSADPRVGAAVQIPKLKWVLRGFYGRYYQPPPLVTVQNPALAGSQCTSSANLQCFIPLHGERDEQHEFGITIPFAGWTLDAANFRTGARNFFDHDVLGNSNVFFPLTLSHARLRGWEATATSPRLAGFSQWHMAYSHAYAEWSGAVTGGLIGGDSCDTRCFLDHDQRDTLSTGLDLSLPWKSTANLDLTYGSGFLNGDGFVAPIHLPQHTTFDLALAKSFGERLTVRLTGLNLSNNHYLLDNSNTFGGTHFVNPRETSVQLAYKFRY